MKKTYTLILSIFIGLTSVVGQTTCIDTIYYPQSKLTTVGEFVLMDQVTTGIEGVSQTFNANTGFVHGIRAFVTPDDNGIVGDGTAVDLQISVVDVDADNKPIAVIASELVNITDLGDVRQNLMFTSPVAVSGKYAVVVELNPLTAADDTAYFMTNDATAGDGAGEGLMAYKITSAWFNFYIDFVGASNADALLAPIFEKTIEASYITSLDTVCLGSSVLFTNTTSSVYDSMYNTSNDTNNLILGDLSGAILDTTYMHTYATVGTFNTELIVTQYGYTGNCVDTAYHNVTVIDGATANFGFVEGGATVQFNDSSTNAVTWLWDLGDGNFSTDQNPLHNYAAAGNYTVCLIVTDLFNCDPDTICKPVSFATGIDDFDATAFVNVYPVPANKYVKVSVPSNYYEGKIVIFDVLGKTLKSIDIDNEGEVRISTEGIDAGIYFVSIDKDGERLFTERIIINK